MDIYTIYKATNLINGKSYIGFTSKTLKSRQDNHRRASKNPQFNSIFYKAIKKYGWDNFTWEILFENYDREYVLKTMEPFFISKYNTLNEGYNISKGGDGRFTKHSLETKQKISKSETGKIVSIETRQKQSLAAKGNKNCLGRKHSDETKQKLRLAILGKKRGPYKKSTSNIIPI